MTGSTTPKSISRRRLKAERVQQGHCWHISCQEERHNTESCQFICLTLCLLPALPRQGTRDPQLGHLPGHLPTGASLVYSSSSAYAAELLQLSHLFNLFLFHTEVVSLISMSKIKTKQKESLTFWSSKTSLEYAVSPASQVIMSYAFLSIS